MRFELFALHPKNNTFPGEVFLELAADAIEVAGASREEPIIFEGIRERYRPECTAHTNAQHDKSKFALRAAAMIRAGVDPGLLDEVIWWQTDDLWVWALDALVVYVQSRLTVLARLSLTSANGSLAHRTSTSAQVS